MASANCIPVGSCNIAPGSAKGAGGALHLRFLTDNVEH